MPGGNGPLYESLTFVNKFKGDDHNAQKYICAVAVDSERKEIEEEENKLLESDTLCSSAGLTTEYILWTLRTLGRRIWSEPIVTGRLKRYLLSSWGLACPV